jgi:hypothetical protein
MDDSCLFCRIVSGELPATVVYEDENAVAFLDHRPLFPAIRCSYRVNTLRHSAISKQNLLPLTSKRRNYSRVQLKRQWRRKELLLP